MPQVARLQRCLFVAFLMLFSMYVVVGNQKHSPYYQHLEDCDQKGVSGKFVKKKTASKGIVCPMVKDEEGFLSEWVAYYEMQGFDHIIFYDNNSTMSFGELDPWIKTGFVEIKREWWADDPGTHLMLKSKDIKKKFNDMMRLKMLAEVDCKRVAVDMGIDIFVSVDMDEYLAPSRNDITVMDELAEWFKSTTRGVCVISKLQFPPTPHILEPIHLLTIEAYQTRYPIPDRMNYYTSVSRKVALKLLGQPDYNANTTTMMINCCDFHGCGNYKFNKTCPDLIYSETGNILGKHRPWKDGPHIHHYARSLEKYILKQKTWETASGHDSTGYSIYNFLDRVSGWEFDDSLIAWGCQLRELLRTRTGVPDYVRPGDIWYRNPEYGKLVDDPHKRGRYGGGYGKQLGPREMNPYPPQDTYQRAHKRYEPKPESGKGGQRRRLSEQREIVRALLDYHNISSLQHRYAQ